MKKLLTFLTLLTLFFGVGWAAEVTDTWTATSGDLGSSSSGISGTITTSGNKSWTYVRNKTVYAGWNSQASCIQLGSGNGAENITFFTSAYGTATIKSVSVECASYQGKHNISITVGGSSYLNSTAVPTWSNNTLGTKTGTGNSSGEIEINITDGTRALYIKSISITYEEGGSQQTTYNVNLKQTTGGTISASPTTAAEGATVTLTATPNPGYEFTSWEVLDGDANEVTVTNNQFTMPASDVEVEATFTALQTYGITVTGGTASPTSAYAGQTVTVTPTIPDGKVVDWENTTISPASVTLANNGSSYTFTMPNEAVTVVFAFMDAPTTQTATLTNANIVAAGTGATGYNDWEMTDENGKTWNAHAIKNQHSNNTSSYHYLQIKKSTTSEPCYLQVPEYGTRIVKLEMTVSNTSQPMTGGSNSATLYFSNSNTTSATGTGVAFGTGASSVTIDCSNLNMNTGYITASAAVRIWNVTVTYESGEVVEVPDLYIIGQVNGHDSDPWVSTEGVQMTYNSTNENYTADIYCTGVNNGTHEGYSLFLFAKSLPYDWNTTSNLYGSGADGSYWGIGGTNESAFGDEIPLYEGSKNSYRLPAGLYTVTADLDYTGHQYTTKSVKVTKRDVIMTISPNSATFETTKNVTMSSNLTEIGGKIYYTTNGNDPRDPNSGRIEYTGELTIDATTTFKAVAFIGNLYSEVVEKTYIKTPAAPVITPNGGTIYEATQVTITAEEGANIYYTTDGSAPTSENGTLYEGPFTVSATTTVKARAYVGDVYSSVTTAEFTYSNVQPSTGDFVLVTSSNELIAGNEYIIVTTYEDLDDNWDPVVFNYAMGALTTGNSPKGSRTTDFTLTGTIGASGSRIAVGSEVNVLTLGGSAGAWTLKQQDGNYISLSTGDTNISGKASSTPLLITVDSDEYDAYIGNNGSSNDRQILYQIGSANVFGNYKSSNVGGANFPNVYLYTRESNSVQPPVFTPAGGVYDVPVDVTISCATTGASIYYTTDGTEPSATNGTLYNGEEFLVSETTTYKAVAVKNGNTSSVVTAEYTIAPHTAIETVTLDYSEPFTAGIGKFVVENVSGYSPVWTLDGNYGIKGTAYNANTNPTNNAAVSRFLSPIIDMTDATQPELTFAYQINGFFTNASEQCTLWIRETTNGTSGTWIQLPLSFQTPAEGDWSNEYADISLNDYAGKKVQISFLYNNPEAGTGAGTWEIQNFVVADNSEYKMVNNIAEFLALDNGQKAKFRNPVTVLYDYSQYSKGTYQEYIWVKDETGFTQIFLQPSLDGQYGTNEVQRAYYENGDVIPAGFIVTKQYYTNGGYYQAFSNQATEEGKSGFQEATTKALADPEPFTVAELANLQMTQDNIDTYNNRYVRVNKLKITSKSGKNFNFTNDQNITVTTVGYNKYSDTGSVLKDGTTTAVVDVPDAGNTYYNVTAILQKWDDVWEIMPISFTPWEEKTVTLRELCDKGVVNEEYTISNPLQVVYVDTDRHSVWVKDDNGQSIWSTSPAATDKNFAIDYAGNTRDNQAYYDQSNWCQLVFASADDIPSSFASNPIINGGIITGKFTNKMNPTLEITNLGEDPIMTASSSYATNYYVARNFAANSDGYFFMNPKPQEYADVVWAIYDSSNNAMIMPSNSEQNPNGFVGSFKVDMSMNIKPNLELVDGTQTGKGYEHFKAIVRLASTSNAPMLKDRMPANTEYVVFPLDITQDVPTGITDVNGKAVKSVKYVNVAGMVSDKPFSGVNIVVTEYTDGSRSTSKMIKR